MQTVNKWDLFELTVTGPATGNPFTERHFGAAFTHNRETVSVEGFYDGEGVICPQSISYSLLCRYFREAVLPADRELFAEITEVRDTRKKCEMCGKPFFARSNRAKFCDSCAPIAARRCAAERKRRQREKVRKVTEQA